VREREGEGGRGREREGEGGRGREREGEGGREREGSQSTKGNCPEDSKLSATVCRTEGFTVC
jgi:hypothetical protein